VSAEDISAVKDKMNQNPFVTLGEEFSSYYKINKQAQNSPHYIPPRECKLLPNQHGDVTTFQYISVIEIVTSLVKCPDFELLRNSPTTSTEDCLYDVKDGSAWKDNIFFQENPDALSGHLYSDAVELNNPLGATKGVNKALNVYFTLFDLPKYLRTKIENIFLVLSVRESQLKATPGNYALFFKPLVDDLKKLESGILVGGKLIKMGLVCYSADNLEAHAVGGFSQCFSSYDVCRMCHQQHQDLQNISGVSKEKPWTKEEFDVEAASTEHGIRGEFGLNSICLLNDLESFHCVGQLPFDIMHDFHEKVAAFDGMSILKNLVKSGLFTFHQYNQVLHDIKLFDYEVGDRPLPVNENSPKLTGKAMVVCQHLRLMPFLVWRVTGGNVEQSDLMDLLVLLARIQEILMADKLTQEDVDNFEEIVVEFFFKRKLCAAKYQFFSHIVPKYHYLGTLALQKLIHIVFLIK
jgi:hypothetical protein